MVWLRDNGRCCLTKHSKIWWDMLGWTQTLVLQLVPSRLIQGLGDSSLRETLAAFLTEAQLQLLIQCLELDPNNSDQLKNLWTLEKNAASAFYNGYIYLEPGFNKDRVSADGCTSDVCNFVRLQV